MQLEGLTDADLMIKCGFCDGSGIVYNPVWRRYSAAMLDRTQEVPEIHEVLDQYEREVPEAPQEPERIGCRECDSRGMVPTPAGRTILEFVRRFR